MSNEIRSAIKRLEREIHALESKNRDLHNTMRQLEKDASTIRRDRVSGVLAGRVDPREILTKERRLRSDKKQMDSIKQQLRINTNDIQHKKHDHNTLQMLANKVDYGDQHALYQIKKLLWRV